MNPKNTAGTVALVIGHCAGMIDLVALPVWIGIVLMGRMGLSPQQAGGLATLFLVSVVASSLFFAPRLNRVRRRRLVTAAFALAGLAFAAMTLVSDYAALAALHSAAGLAVGCALSLTHGTMGTHANPHRLASIAFTALGGVSLAFLATVPALVGRLGTNAFFMVLAAIMSVAALAALWAFPASHGHAGTADAATAAPEAKLPRRILFGMAGVSLLTLNQALTFGFLERIGAWHGFSAGQVAGLLVAVGFVNLFPAAIAGMLEKRCPAPVVMCIAPVAQGLLGLTVTQASGFAVYAVATCLFISTLIFTHNFAFGYLAREDRSGRSVAATPVMVMTGSACGPLLGGVLAQHLGYASLGWAALAIGLLSALSFRRCVRGRDIVRTSEAMA